MSFHDHLFPWLSLFWLYVATADQIGKKCLGHLANNGKIAFLFLAAKGYFWQCENTFLRASFDVLERQISRIIHSHGITAIHTVSHLIITYLHGFSLILNRVTVVLTKLHFVIRRISNNRINFHVFARIHRYSHCFQMFSLNQ